MLTATTLEAMYDQIKTAIPIAEVSVKVGGEELEALLVSKTYEIVQAELGVSNAGTWELWVKKALLPVAGLSDGDRVELKEGDQWNTRRAKNVVNYGDVLISCELAGEYEQ